MRRNEYKQAAYAYSTGTGEHLRAALLKIASNYAPQKTRGGQSLFMMPTRSSTTSSAASTKRPLNGNKHDVISATVGQTGYWIGQ